MESMLMHEGITFPPITFPPTDNARRLVMSILISTLSVVIDTVIKLLSIFVFACLLQGSYSTM